MNIVRNILSNTSKDKYNILCAPTHEAYETGLAKTGHNFFAFRSDGIKDWNVKYRPLPDNYILLPKNNIPNYLNFDLVLSQNKFGQFQKLAPIAHQLGIPLISLEHTLPFTSWNENTREQLRQMRGKVNIFISEYSVFEWGWNNNNDTEIIYHGIDTDIFCVGEEVRQVHALSVVNDWVNRDWCKLPGQKVFTDNGYVNIEDVKVGDKVLTDSGNMHYVYKTISRKYNGDIIQIFTSRLKTPICFTPEHQIRVYRDGQEKYIEANRLRAGDILKFPKITTNRFECNDTELSWLIGNIIGDGSITNKGGISIVFNDYELDRMCLCKNILSKYCNTNISNRCRKKAKVSILEGTSKIFGLWLKDLIGQYSKVKRIPDYIFYGSDDIRLSCLQGLWACDGSFKNGKRGLRFVYSTTSIKLAGQVSALLHHFGIQCFISKEKRTTNKSNGKIVYIYRVRSSQPDNVKKCEKLINKSITNGPYQYVINNVKIVEYNGDVYNCSVESDPSYVVYPGFVAHNCCNFAGWQRITKDLPVKVLGDTPGLSKPASSLAELVNAYQSSLVFLNTSTISPIPTSLLEAMACGCCPISTATCMIPEIIEDGVNGFCSNNEARLRNDVINMLRNPDRAISIGAKARQTILNKFSEKKFIDRWNTIFRSTYEG